MQCGAGRTITYLVRDDNNILNLLLNDWEVDVAYWRPQAISDSVRCEIFDASALPQPLRTISGPCGFSTKDSHTRPARSDSRAGEQASTADGGDDGRQRVRDLAKELQ